MLLTAREVADKLRVHRQVVKVWLRSGRLKGIKIGTRGDWRVSQEDLDTYLKEMNK